MVNLLAREILISLPALYISPPPRVTRSAWPSLILVMQSSVVFPATQLAVTSKLRFCAVFSTYVLKTSHLLVSCGKAHHLKLNGAEKEVF